MKLKANLFRLLISLACFLLVISILTLQIPPCYAQSIDPTVISLSADGIPSMEYLQGDDGYVEVWIKNNGTDTVEITSVSAHFSWTKPNVFSLSLGGGVTISVDDEKKLGEISFNVPANATVGDHSYYLYVEFKSPPGGDDYTWQTDEYPVWVEDFYKGLYDEFFSTAYSKLFTAREAVADATSAIESLGAPQNQEASSLLSQAQGKLEEAQTYLNQAENTYNDASTSYSSKAFEDAYSSLQECANAADNASAFAAEASSLAAQAQQKEVEQQQEQQQQEQQRRVHQIILFGIPVAVVVVAFVVIVLIRKRK